KADGNANLFIINPYGISFGTNATLNIGGSFLASSAEAIKLADGTIFSAKNPQNTPLLTISVPVGLQFGDTPGTIENLSTVSGVGLQVPTGKTLALVGGDVTLNGGLITVNQGRIELGGVGQGSEVKIIPTPDGFTLNYDQVQHWQNISFINIGAIDTSGDPAGNINIQGKNLIVNDDSYIQAGTIDNLGGDININTSDSIIMQGASYISAFTDGTGKSGNININTKHLLLQDGPQILPFAFGEGQSGNLNVKADTITIDGYVKAGPYTGFPSGLFSITSNQGNTGNVTIITNILLVRNGGQIFVGSSGAGKGGLLDITAKSIELIGSAGNNQFLVTGLFANTENTGAAGNLTVNAESIIIKGGAQIAAIT
ncbi:MAG TPA: filamentous hemagglutinin N-terminal domain-containing protein, partial [Allocoleopsis sp.]